MSSLTTADTVEQVSGALLVPAAVMAEMSCAAAEVLTDEEAARPLLTHLTVSAPLVLSGMTTPAVVIVRVSPAGQAEILSQTATTRRPSRLHSDCIVARMPLQPSGDLM